MWLKLVHEFLNLDHVVRVRINKGWKNGIEEVVAEVEGLLKGEVQVFTRYRGAEAEILQEFLEGQAALREPDLVGPAQALGPGLTPDETRGMAPTLADVKLP